MALDKNDKPVIAGDIVVVPCKLLERQPMRAGCAILQPAIEATDGHFVEFCLHETQFTLKDGVAQIAQMPCKVEVAQPSSFGQNLLLQLTEPNEFGEKYPAFAICARRVIKEE